MASELDRVFENYIRLRGQLILHEEGTADHDRAEREMDQLIAPLDNDALALLAVINNPSKAEAERRVHALMKRRARVVMRKAVAL